MTGIEIVVLIVGIIFVLGSFFVGDKLSSKDVDQIAQLSREQLNRIVEKELNHAQGQIQNTVDETIENSVLKIERMMDKEANQKMKPYCSRKAMDELFATLQRASVKKEDLNTAIFCYDNRQYKACALVLLGVIDAKLIRKQNRNGYRCTGSRA